MAHLLENFPELWEREETYSRNEYLVTPGSQNTNTYFVVDGAIRVFLNENSEEHTIRFGYKGSVVTPLHSFLGSAPNPFHFQALRKTVVKVISKDHLNNFIQKHERGTQMYQKLLEELVLQQMEREVDILISSPIKRLERVLKRSPKLFQEVPLKYIASYLRMTPETLSRIYKS